MQKPIIVILLIILLASFFIALNNKQNRDINEVCIKESCFKVQLAITPEEKRTGLMNTTIKEDEGMLFIYNTPGYYTFWMKNTIQPLDIIWVNKNLEIIDFVTAYPCRENCPTFSPSEPASYILEISPGKASQLEAIKKEKIRIK